VPHNWAWGVGAMTERLIVHNHNQPVQQYWLDRAQRYQVGRDADCEIRIIDSRVSRNHASLFYDNDCWFLQDNGSKNGTVCGGEQILQTDFELPDATWLSLGGVLVRFEHVSAQGRMHESYAITKRRLVTRNLIRQINPKLGLLPLLQKVLESILTTSGTERGFIMLKRQDNDMHVVACRGLLVSELQNQSFLGSAGAVDLAVHECRPVFYSDAMEEFALSNRPSIQGGHIRALVCIPITLDECIIGVVYADSNRIGKVFTELDAELLGALAEQAALALNVVRVREEIDAISDCLPDNGSTQGADQQSSEPAYENNLDNGGSSNKVGFWGRLRRMHRDSVGIGDSDTKNQ
jgi:pSer/pThr/pTyr-binding forkhead associated (FHA) protein